MTKEANKSTVIVLLVIAGALLFLIGSFTGQAFTWFSRGEGQSCFVDAYCQMGLKCINKVCTKVTTTPTQPTTGLTTDQRTEVLSLIKNEISKSIAPGSSSSLRLGILDILNSCYVIHDSMTTPYNGIAGQTCSEVCSNNKLICIAAYYMKSDSTLKSRLECSYPIDSILNLGDNYQCVCCTP